MDEQVIKFRVGIVLLAAICVLSILIMSFSTLPDFLKGTYTLHVQFPGASGVAVDSPVRKSGVPIGRVTDVKLEESGGVLLTIKIDEKYKLRKNERCRIRVDSLVTGDAVVEFVQRSPAELLQEFDANKNGRLDEGEEKDMSMQLLTDGEYISNGTLSTDPLQVFVNLEEKMSKAFTAIESAGHGIEEASQEVATLVRGVNNVFSGKDDQIRRLMTKSESALESMKTTLDSVNNIVGDPELNAGLRRAIGDVPKLFKSAQDMLADVQTTLRTFRSVAGKAEAGLDNLQKLSKPLADKADQIADDLAGSVENLESLLSQLAKFAKSVNESDGTLGQLVNDRELYDRLRGAAVNVEESTKRLRPILEDIRIFSDKIATDPRILGVRGAVSRQPTGTGLKSPSWR